MGNLMGNTAVPQYVKLLAAGMLALTYCGALVVAGFALVNNQPIPQLVTFVLGTGVALSGNVLGLHSGAQLAETTPTPLTAPVTVTPAPVTVTPPAGATVAAAPSTGASGV